jgi:hypothetical protein
MLSLARRITLAIVGIVAVTAAVAPAVTATGADYAGDAFSVSIDNPTVKVGAKALIVATILPRDGFRITPSYRHRIVNLSATDDGAQVAAKVVRGSVTDGTVVFRVEVVPKTTGPHQIIGVFRFSVNNGERLDIKAAPFEATVTATD